MSLDYSDRALLERAVNVLQTLATNAHSPANERSLSILANAIDTAASAFSLWVDHQVWLDGRSSDNPDGTVQGS